MPGYTQNGGRYFVSYITGPSHISLGLSFGQAVTKPVLIRQSKLGQCKHGSLDERQILDAVITGVAASKSGLHPVEIIYVEDDSPRYDLYQHCAYLLSRRVASGEKFEKQS